MKTEREVLEYVYDRMVGVHLEQWFQWYMLELRRIINRMGKEEPGLMWRDPVRERAFEHRALELVVKMEGRVKSLEDNVADHERQLGVLNRAIPDVWAEGERRMRASKEPYPGEKVEEGVLEEDAKTTVVKLGVAGPVSDYRMKIGAIRGATSPKAWVNALQMLIPESAGGWIYHVEETGEVRIVQDGKVKVDTIKPWERWTPLRFYVEQVIDKIEHGERGAGDDYPVQDDKVAPV